MLPTRGVAHLLFHIESDAVLVAANGGAYRNSANLFLIPLNYAHRFGFCSHDLVKAKAVATSIHRPQTIVVISSRPAVTERLWWCWLAGHPGTIPNVKSLSTRIYRFRRSSPL